MGVVTEAVVDVKNESVVTSMDVVGTNSILLAKLDPFLFLFSEWCFLSVLFASELCVELPGSFFCTEARLVMQLCPSFLSTSEERGLVIGFLLIIGGSLSTSSGGLEGSFVPVERKRSLAATGLRRGMELGVYGADGVLEGEGELEYRNVTELSNRVGGLWF